jgi:hypothetical protein
VSTGAYQPASFGYNTRASTEAGACSDVQVGIGVRKTPVRLALDSCAVFLGLSLALLALGVKFFQAAWKSSQPAGGHGAGLVLTVLAMIDIVLVGSLIVMVMFSGYENFVSTIDAKGSGHAQLAGQTRRGDAQAQGGRQHRGDLLDSPAAHLHEGGRQDGRHLHQRPDHVVRSSCT